MGKSVLFSNATSSFAEDTSCLECEVSVRDVGQDDRDEGALRDGGGWVLEVPGQVGPGHDASNGSEEHTECDKEVWVGLKFRVDPVGVPVLLCCLPAPASEAVCMSLVLRQSLDRVLRSLLHIPGPGWQIQHTS